MKWTPARCFLTLAGCGAALLAASFEADPCAPVGLGSWLGRSACGLTLATHGVALGYLAWAARRVARLAGAGELPGWAVHQAEKHWRKGRLFGVSAVTLLATAAALGSGWPARLPLLSLGASAAALSFHLGAVGVELAVIGAQSRLTRVGRVARRAPALGVAGVAAR